MRLLLLSLSGLFVTGFLIFLLANFSTNNHSNDEISVSNIMSGEASGFKKADSIRNFSFPKDHFAHNDYRTEGWDVTGNLSTKEGRRFRYQFTIFRNGILPGTDNDSVIFSQKSLYSIHIGISDIQNQKFYSFERFARGLDGLAGSNETEKRIYIEGNEILFDFSNDAMLPTLQVSSSTSEFQISFKLIPEKKIVLHGDKGLSKKSNKPGNASYYYSYTRLTTTGELTIKGEKFDLTGNSWMDREWSTSALESDQKGWDWFALQMEDGTELMYFRLRDSTGATNFQKGTLIRKDGSYELFSGDDFKITPIMNSKIDGITYPFEWEIELKPLNFLYVVSVAMKNQVHPSQLRYYEGAIDVVRKNGKDISTGVGYVELTGYRE
ncbi:MAG: carotenoid 1,2-hydratase [Ignavibacteriales bacterium]|nr:carotenoid 1,2-hydratase [Ignavibacteriales bacterium]